MPYFLFPIRVYGNDKKEYHLHNKCTYKPQPEPLFKTYSITKPT